MKNSGSCIVTVYRDLDRDRDVSFDTYIRLQKGVESEIPDTRQRQRNYTVQTPLNTPLRRALESAWVSQWDTRDQLCRSCL